MGSEWREVRLGDLAEIYDGPHATPHTVADGPMFLGIVCLDNGRLDLTKAEHLTETDFSRWTRRVTPIAGDVVFSYETRIGEAGRIPPGFRGCLGRRMGLLRPKPNVDPSFLLYAYLAPEFQETLRSRTIHGSTVDRIPLVQLGDFPIRVPPVAEQRVIGSVLAVLDEKIELNRRMSQTLESMARALFKSWFVDFDPVRAKLEGLSSGLPWRVEGLFPDSLDDSELGEIPAGWRVATLSEVADLNPESWSRDTRPASIEYVDLANTKSGRIEATASYSSSDAPSRAQRVLRPGDTIFGTVRPGNRSYALVADEGLTGSTGFAVLRPRQNEQRAFVYLCATADSSIDDLSRLADGAAYPAVRPEVVLATAALLPVPDNIMTVFCATTASLLDRCCEAGREIRSLASIRDELLPQLLRVEGPTLLPRYSWDSHP